MIKPDWEAIESAYRAGVMSLREIASQNGISEGAIRNPGRRFEKNGAELDEADRCCNGSRDQRRCSQNQ